MKQDLEHLKLLSIFHYIVGGLGGLFACFPIIHLTIGLSLVFGEMGREFSEPGAPPAIFGWMFILIPAFIILLGWAYAISTILAGRFLSQHKNRLYCLVMAGISCVFMPFGTVLGVFTIIVLMRPSVQELFEGSEASEVG